MTQASHRRRRRAGVVSAVVATGLLTGACAARPGAPLPAPAHALEIGMQEYRFDYGSVPAGRVVFRVSNHGRRYHRLSLIPLPPDLPPLVEQLRGKERRVLSTLAAVPDIRPGGEGTFAVDLSPGRYGLVCFIVERDGTSHALEGMASEFRIR